MIYKLLRKKLTTSSVIVEIGAHIGTDTKRLLDFCSDGGKLIAFEPVKSNADKLRALRNPCLTVVQKAVSSSAESRIMYVSSGRKEGSHRNITDLSSLKPPKNMRDRKWVRFQKEKVMCITLDEFFDDFDMIDLIWCDTQGSELDVIAGGQNTLKKTSLFYFECLDKNRHRYSDQPACNEVISALPGKWELLLKTPTDVFMGRRI